jgi:hypothetical protein
MSDDISLLNHKFDVMSETVTDMKTSLKELTSAITKLTLIEERQLNAAASLERAFKTIESIDKRVGQLEQHVPANKRVSVWLDRATWAGMGLLCMLVIKKSGLL